ncbi:hypothetical protein BD779DRAFT_1528146 [Infundibulicybe gibba]|nr:hypothetical protein BD779DRAFT_1528146 [Infundibulicybe gibba]
MCASPPPDLFHITIPLHDIKQRICGWVFHQVQRQLYNAFSNPGQPSLHAFAGASRPPPRVRHPRRVCPPSHPTVLQEGRRRAANGCVAVNQEVLQEPKPRCSRVPHLPHRTPLADPDLRCTGGRFIRCLCEPPRQSAQLMLGALGGNLQHPGRAGDREWVREYDRSECREL